MSPEEAEKYGSPRARNRRKYANTDEIYGVDEGNRGRIREHLDNRKYDDPEQDNVPGINAPQYTGFNKRWKERQAQLVPFFEEKGSGGNYDYGGLDSAEGKHLSLTDEVIELDSTVREGDRAELKQGQVVSYNGELYEVWRARNTDESNKYEGLDNNLSPQGNYSNRLVLRKLAGKNPGDFWSIATQPSKVLHFASFPLAICWNGILASCPPNGVVMDIFAGIGTVGEATEILNITNKVPSKDLVNQIRKTVQRGVKPLAYMAQRNFILVDINREYCEIATKRVDPYLRLRSSSSFIK